MCKTSVANRPGCDVKHGVKYMLMLDSENANARLIAKHTVREAKIRRRGESQGQGLHSIVYMEDVRTEQ